jgi:hypothetical protein
LAFSAPPWVEVAAAGLLLDVSGDVLEGVPQPASATPVSATAAAPARTTRADLYLLMPMPCPAKIEDPWACVLEARPQSRPRLGQIPRTAGRHAERVQDLLIITDRM